MRIAACLFVLLGAAAARAELKPEELVLLVTPSKESRELAEYYAQARGVPAQHILALDVRPGQDLARADWDQKVRPAILAWLAQNKLEGKVRCFVSVWDVPLRIGGQPQDAPAAVARRAWLAAARQSSRARFAGLLAAVEGLAAKEKPAPQPPAVEKGAGELAKEFEAALREANRRVQALDPGAERRQAEGQLEQLFLAGGGAASLVTTAGRQTDPEKLTPEVARRIELTKAQLQGLQQGVQALMSLPDSVARDEQIAQLLQQTGGLLGVLRWIDEQQQALEKNETAAAFDSELAIVLWPETPLNRWLPNPLHYSFDKLPNKRVTFMTSRLAAPKVELVRGTIDNAIAVEKAGLTGKVYLDARGLAHDAKASKPGSYDSYDQSIRDLADRLKRHTKLEVVWDNEAKLFPPGSCPDAALYCGWYSLANYVDAFTWRPGAVGCHIASSEAVDLRTPGSKLWCPAMLERGVAATFGPTFEPYLSAFPPPDDFFPLLLTGRFTLAETYWRTCPFTSWAMVLVGDPLYTPFKKSPPLDDAALPERMKGR